MTRSYLYVPGNRPDRFGKAIASGADAIILDLEDAVPHAEKDAARGAVAAWLAEHGAKDVWIRVNGGDLLEPDVRAVVSSGARGITLPKVGSAHDVEMLDRALGDSDARVTALIETASGVLDARAIASAPRVVSLAIGEADLAAELGIEPSEDGRDLAPMRAQVVLASAAAGIGPPIASISTDFRDLDAFRRSTDALRRMGFGARAAIHPGQVPVINEVFTPTASEVEAARALLRRFEAAGGGVCVDENGRMVDEAVVRAARSTLARAGQG